MTEMEPNGLRSGDTFLQDRLREVEKKVAVLETQRSATDKATLLQAKEYERRLNQLNHEHERVRSVQGSSVTQERFEEYLKTEEEKRETALERINEKFDDYIKRYEIRQREIDQALQNQKQMMETKNAVLEASTVQAQRLSEEQGRKNNRNIAIASVCLTAIIVGMNLITSF